MMRLPKQADPIMRQVSMAQSRSGVMPSQQCPQYQVWDPNARACVPASSCCSKHF